MKNLSRLLRVLENRIRKAPPSIPYNYAVPDVWNRFGYAGAETRTTRQGELIVDPYRFHAAVIRDAILPAAHKGRNYAQPLSLMTAHSPGDEDSHYAGGDWIRRATVYSTLIRCSAAWDHDRSGDLEACNLYDLPDTGTFVKMLALLPTLKRMGVNTVYLLPISKFSLKDRKGELGSPYGVSNFFELDPMLKDAMTGEAMTLEQEFSAFVEACHILEMRVMIDIIPRTNSVNSDLIAEHPEWFYWIRQEDLPGYRPPVVPGLGAAVVPKPQFLPDIYQSEDVWNHLRKFVEQPADAASEAWAAMVARWRAGEGELLDLVRETFGVTVAPAFSDHINDPQPPWTDVTFFRMFLDHPRAALPWLGEKADSLAPYILFDTIKSNLYEGEVPNESLWNTLADIIPHFQRAYGIDGARIDMGHALPEALVRMIIARARKIDPDFCFIAEELYPERAQAAKDLGYNMIIGQGFYMEPRIWDFLTHAYIYGSKDLPLPVFASGETHDTPRMAAREGGRTLSTMLTALNLFMPNGIPFINSGQEVYETQPMNTGLDCRENEAFLLPREDPGYGKLALFDRAALHYLNPGRWDMLAQLEKLSEIRRNHLDTLSDARNFVGLGFAHMRIQAIGLGWVLAGHLGEMRKNALLVIANTHLYDDQQIFVNIEDLRLRSGNLAREAQQIFSTAEGERPVREFDEAGNLHLFLRKGEVKVLHL